MENERNEEDEFVNTGCNNDNLFFQTKHIDKEFDLEDIDAMIQELSSINKLKSIKMLFPGYNLPTFFGTLQECLAKNNQNLEKFKLMIRQSNLSRIKCDQLSNIISQFKNLKKIYLSLRDNNMGDEGTINLINKINELQYLNRFKIGVTDCNLSKEALNSISNLLENKKNQLIKLQVHIGGNFLNTEDIIQFIHQASHVKNLTYLNLYFDGLPISNQTILALCQTISGLQELNTFHLSILNSFCTNSGYYKLAQTLQSKEKLQKLFIQLREKFRFSHILLKSFGLIHFKRIPINSEFILGIHNFDQETKIEQNIRLLEAHLLQLMVFYKNVASFLPLHGQHVLYDLIDI